VGIGKIFDTPQKAQPWLILRPLRPC